MAEAADSKSVQSGFESQVRYVESMHATRATTLNEARLWLRERMGRGARCPACEQVVKVYRRTITSGMASFLVYAAREQGHEWFHATDFIDSRPLLVRYKARADYAKLRYWDLLEAGNDRREDGNRSGNYRVTDRGLLFAAERVEVPKYALIYDDRRLRLEGEPMHLADAFRSPFDYAQIMSDAQVTA